FAGGFTLDAAEAVCAGVRSAGPRLSGDDGLRNPEPVTAVRIDVLPVLASLVEKSLVHVEERGGATRYVLLETVRQYGCGRLAETAGAGAGGELARERLAVRGELEEARRRHARHFLAYAVEAIGHLASPDPSVWLDPLETEHDNLRAALRWAIERADVALAGSLAWNLMIFWYYPGHFREGRALLAAVLALPAAPEGAGLRADLLRGRGMLARESGDHAAARADLEEAVVVACQTGDQSLLAQNVVALGVMARVQEDYAIARAALEEGLTLAR